MKKDKFSEGGIVNRDVASKVMGGMIIESYLPFNAGNADEVSMPVGLPPFDKDTLIDVDLKLFTDDISPDRLKQLCDEVGQELKTLRQNHKI